MEFEQIQGVKSGRRLEGKLGQEIHLLKMELLRQGLTDQQIFEHAGLNKLRAEKNQVHAVVKQLARERRARRKRLRRDRAQNGPKPKVTVTRTVAYQYNPADDSRLAAFYASKEWRLIRYEALRLHGGRCQCCGASPEDGATVLNVDHIKPLRVFWDLRLELSNLQVLCNPCNEGKGARHADDWRATTGRR